VHIKPFGVEIWMNEFENHCAFNLAETCVESLTIGQLLQMSGKNDTLANDLAQMKMTYGAIEGSDRLRSNICTLYDNQAVENVVVTHGAIGANALLYEALIQPGDHIISVLPTYQQHYSIPESYGAEVEVLQLEPDNAFLPDLDRLATMIRPNTRLIAVTNPNNPTGALMDRAFLERLADVARAGNVWVLSDEVYRGTNQSGDGFAPAIADVYEKGISVGGMSKTFSLAGLRLGWIAAPVEVIQAVSIHRDYNTISVGMIDDYFAAMALEAKDKIIARSQQITRDNLATLDAWIAQEPALSYVRPKAGTTALVRYDFDMPSREFCVRLLKETGVMFTPGSVMEMEGWVRIGYANNPQVLRDGLKEASRFLAMLEQERSMTARQGQLT
jgi:aspartate/methionine/tyrosine aminotransferase